MLAQNAWQQMNDFPSIMHWSSGSMILDDIPYIVVNDEYFTYLFKYDVNTDSWNSVYAFPIESPKDGPTFSLNGKGYINYYNGSQNTLELHEYNPATNEMIQKTGAYFPSWFGPSGYSATAFSINGIGYLMTTGVEDPFQAYDSGTDTWSVKNPIPNDNIMKDVTSFSIGDKGYILYGQNEAGVEIYDLWQYDPTIEQWTQKASAPPTSSTMRKKVFVIGDVAYVGMGSIEEFATFWRYDSVANEWGLIESCGYNGVGSFAFAIGNKGYVGLGWVVIGVPGFHTQVWSLDPNLLQVSSNSLETVEIFPNPVDDILKFSDLNGEITYSLYDISGKLVNKGSIKNNQLDMSNLAAGVYMLKLFSSENILVKRVLKM